MNHLGEAYYRLGMEQFHAGEYEQSVASLIKAYELEYEREAVLKHLYASFIAPKQDEFRKNYASSCEGITQIPYEGLSLDFIPICEDRFYIFNRRKQTFEGIFDLERNPVRGKRIEFQSVLYADTWDIRQLLPELKEREWGTVYLLLNDAEPEFASFLKLPRFREIFLRNVKAFKDADSMYHFFEQHDEISLPQKVIPANPDILSMIRQLHRNRICSTGKERKNIFLSICIPSYNRGSRALKNVLHLLQCPFDSEIEIVVSNNGSTKDVEGYRSIKELQDSRVVYHEFDENQGFTANILQVLKVANGKYAVLTSDEDLMRLEYLPDFLSYLKANASGGVFSTGGIGALLSQAPEQAVYRAGIDAIGSAMNLQYLTGMTYNMSILRERHILETVDSMRAEGNLFLELYVITVIFMLIGKYGDLHKVRIILWHEGKEDNPRMLNYMYPESRIIQWKDMMKMLVKDFHLEYRDFLNIFWRRWHLNHLVLLEVYCAFEDLKKDYTWEDICFYLYREVMQYIEEFPFALEDDEKARLQNIAQNIFMRYLRDGRAWDGLSSEEIRNKKVLHQLIKLELEGCGGEIIVHILPMIKNILDKDEVFLDQCLREAEACKYPIQYIYEVYWKSKNNVVVTATSWDMA
ncbi:MAG: glycosyltransferase family 2 protein [Muribaculum sp.]|nr:glycosyltransferase family 2 protein [Muribaculum sp.]